MERRKQTGQKPQDPRNGEFPWIFVFLIYLRPIFEKVNNSETVIDTDKIRPRKPGKGHASKSIYIYIYIYIWNIGPITALVQQTRVVSEKAELGPVTFKPATLLSPHPYGVSEHHMGRGRTSYPSRIWNYLWRASWEQEHSPPHNPTVRKEHLPSQMSTEAKWGTWSSSPLAMMRGHTPHL